MLGNAAHLDARGGAQTALGAVGATERVLDCTAAAGAGETSAAGLVRAHNPFLREWAVLAVRNLTLEHWGNQQRVAALSLQGVARNEALETMGLRAWTEADPESGLEQLRMGSVSGGGPPVPLPPRRPRGPGVGDSAAWSAEDDPSGLFSHGPVRCNNA